MRIFPVLDGIFFGYLSITVIPMSICMMYQMKAWSTPVFGYGLTRKLAVLSFGAYLVHPVVLEVIHYHGHESLHIHPALAIPILTIVVFLLLLSGAWLIHSLPWLRRTI